MTSKHVWVCVAGAFALATIATTVSAQTLRDLSPQHQHRPQTDSERLQNFRPPPPAPPSYPRIEGQGSDARLHLDQNRSVGGNVTPNSVEGNYRFPIPGTR